MMATLVGAYPQISVAEDAAHRDFMSWTPDAQTAFLQNTVIMASIVSSRTNPEHGDCISDWFFDGNGIQPSVRRDALETISQYRDFRPAAVLVALIEKACGPFGQTPS